MKKLLLIFIFICGFSALSFSQTTGEIKVDSVYSSYLENDFGEATTRKISVYLPPGLPVMMVQ